MTSERTGPAVRRPVTVAMATVVALTAVTLLGVAWSVDHSLPTSAQWQLVVMLLALAVLGEISARRFRKPDPSSPPWDVQTVWIMPACLLLPPSGIAVVVAAALALTWLRRWVSLTGRWILTAAVLVTSSSCYLAQLISPGTALGGLLAVAADWLSGALLALLVATVIRVPQSAATWLDIRWSYVELGAAMSGVLLATAMRVSVWYGLFGVAPLLLAGFALRWMELDRAAGIDAKTGLPNMRQWKERSGRLLASAELHGVGVAVMVIDLDHFKQVNDRYGHLVGDEVLLRIAEALRRATRAGDLLCRFGGEEFIVLCFHVNAGGGVDAAEALRRAVSAQRHRLPTTLPAGSRRADFAVTCSIGVAGSALLGYAAHTLLGRADLALRTAKSLGRNRVCEYTGDTPDGSDPVAGTEPVDQGPAGAPTRRADERPPGSISTQRRRSISARWRLFRDSDPSVRR